MEEPQTQSFNFPEGSLTPADFDDILTALRHQSESSIEDQRQLQEMIHFDQSFRHIESVYATAYSGVLALEKRIAALHEMANCSIIMN